MRDLEGSPFLAHTHCYRSPCWHAIVAGSSTAPPFPESSNFAGVIGPTHGLRLMWFEIPTNTKGGSIQAFLSACPDVGQRGREPDGDWKLSANNKNGAYLFIRNVFD